MEWWFYEYLCMSKLTEMCFLNKCNLLCYLYINKAKNQLKLKLRTNSFFLITENFTGPMNRRPERRYTETGEPFKWLKYSGLMDL